MGRGGACFQPEWDRSYSTRRRRAGRDTRIAGKGRGSDPVGRDGAGRRSHRVCRPHGVAWFALQASSSTGQMIALELPFGLKNAATLAVSPAPTFGVVVFGFITVHQHPPDPDVDCLNGLLIGPMRPLLLWNKCGNYASLNRRLSTKPLKYPMRVGTNKCSRPAHSSVNRFHQLQHCFRPMSFPGR